MRRIQHWITLGLIGIVGWFTSASPAAEVRRKVGDRHIVRTVALQAESETNATDGLSDAEEIEGGVPETVPLQSTLDPSVVGSPIVESHELHDPHGMHGMPLDLFDGGCPACGTVGCGMDCVVPVDRWVKVEYLLWWRKGRDTPPLAISSTDNVNLNNFNLAFDTTDIIYGGTTIGEDSRPGGRITIGTWLDDAEHHGIEGRYWQLADVDTQFSASSDGNTPLGRPFTDTNVNPAEADSRTLAFPGFNTDGRINITSTSEVLGGDIIYRRLIGCDVNRRIYLLGGYQYSKIDEDLLISDSTFIIAEDNTQAITDHFATENQFHAGSIGLAYEYYGNCWHMDILAKVAFGNMNQRVSIAGTTTNDIGQGPVPVVPPQGLLAIDNQGTFSREKFAVAPELGINFAWQLTDAIDVSVGYTYIYWSAVAQPEDQIPVGAGGPLVPSTFTFQDDSYWVHGVNFGGEWRF